MSENKLGLESTLVELFDEIRPAQGMTVVPVSLGEREDGRQDFMIAVTGSAEDARLMVSNLMNFVQELSELAEQKKADEQSSIIVP